MLEGENKFLHRFNRKGGDDDAADALSRAGNARHQFGQGIFFRLRPVAVVRFQHNQVSCLAPGGTRVQHLSRRDSVIAHAANVAVQNSLQFQAGPVGQDVPLPQDLYFRFASSKV
jgi:hypothetical protein